MKHGPKTFTPFIRAKQQQVRENLQRKMQGLRQTFHRVHVHQRGDHWTGGGVHNRRRIHVHSDRRYVGLLLHQKLDHYMNVSLTMCLFQNTA